MKLTGKRIGVLLTGGMLMFLFIAADVSQPESGNRQFRQEFLRRINQLRAQGCNCGGRFMPPAPPMVWNSELEDAAGGHAADMAQQDYFSHTSKDGRNMQDRMVLSGYTIKGYKSFAVGENIAFGQPDITAVMNGWIKSPGHCKNLMNPTFREVGVAENGRYWVQDFGGREAWSAREQQLIKSGRMRVVAAQADQGN